jgi:hypothetical protein
MDYRTRCDRTTKATHAQAARNGKPMTWTEARKVATERVAKLEAIKQTFRRYPTRSRTRSVSRLTRT